MKNGNLGLSTKKILRTFQRYGITPEKICQNVEMFSNIMNKYDAQLTLFIPANIVEKNKKYFKRINFENIQYGAHGYLHLDHSTLDKKVQKEHFKRIVNIFNNEGINEIGFRAPYGRMNGNTFDLLKRYKFQYDSSIVYVFKDMMESNKNVEDVLKEYSIVKEPYPIKQKEILRIPFSLPDDEILVDRLNYNENTIKKIWCEMVKNIEINGNLFVLQLHPHRVRKLKQALNGVLKEAVNSGINIVSLAEFTEKFQKSPEKIKSEKNICITGDIDALKIIEFIK